MSHDQCRQKLTWEPAEGGTWRRTARCERPTGHAGPHNGQGYTWGKFGVTPPDVESRELATLRRYVQHDMAAFGAWCIDNLLSDDCSGCSMPGGRHWDTCPNRWDGRPTRLAAHFPRMGATAGTGSRGRSGSGSEDQGRTALVATRDPRSTVEMLTYAAAWFDDLDDLTETFARVTGQPFGVDRGIQQDLLALARWMAEHSEANDGAFAYVQRNAPLRSGGTTDTRDRTTGAPAGSQGDYDGV